jgi:hypothetical protein
MATLLSQLNATQQRIEMLRADFSGLENLNEVIISVLKKLNTDSSVQTGMQMLKNGSWSLEAFDGWFEPLVRAELGKVLAIVRANAVKKARDNGAGTAAGAVLRRQYKDELAGNINIASPGRRLSSMKRVVDEPKGGRSGIRRERTVKDRTKQLREYFGPDRGFILRILEGGRDVFMATPDGPTGRGSKATYGRRGAIGARNWFFHSMKSDMEQAAQQLGQTLTTAVEKWVEQSFTEA